MNVRGVGEKSFLKLKPLVTVTAPKGSRPANKSVRVRSRTRPPASAATRRQIVQAPGNRARSIAEGRRQPSIRFARGSR